MKQIQRIGKTEEVTILLGTHNGARYLPEQLESIAVQRHNRWQVLASDDASTDATTEILHNFARIHPVSLLQGPGRGHVGNFLHLLAALPDQPTAAVAFCDQDDIWLPEKLTTALEWLYLLITGVGGQVVYDPELQLLYRQHEHNAIGAGEQFSRGLRNKGAVWRGAFADRVGRNIIALQKVAEHLTPDNQRRLTLFDQARHAALPRRLALVRQAGVYRQGRLSEMTFWGAACFGKI